MKVCGVCGKRIAVMWPEFWVYKHGKGEDTTYYCSENCMIVADTREMKDRIGWVDPQAEMTEEEIEAVTHGRPVGFRRLRKTARREEQPAAPAGQERTGQDMGNGMNCNKLTRAQKEKAVQIAISGGDPLDWLRTCGAKNPSAAWFYIKKTVAKADPKLYEKIPEKPGMVINESGQAVPVGIQTAAAGEETAVPAAETAKADDALAGFRPLDVKQRRAPQTIRKEEIYKALGVPAEAVAEQPEVDLTIKAEDLQAAEDPAVARMEAMAAEEPKPEPAGRVVVDASGVHVEPVPEAGAYAGATRLNGEELKLEVLTMFGMPCEVTGLKLEEFEFRRVGDDLMMDYPGPGLLWMDKSLATIRLTVDQWKRVIGLVPKVMKIFGMD